MLRNRRAKALDSVRQLDSFPKLPETYVETSKVGGTLSLLMCGLIIWLVASELNYFIDSRFVFRFTPDTSFDAPLKINIDITVAMPCHTVSADIVDSTEQSMFMFGNLKADDTWFKLSPEQRRQFDSVQLFNSYQREEYHALHEVLFKSRQTVNYLDLPERTVRPIEPPDSCRFHGTLLLNKVAGNFHITAGKSLSLPQGHVHISAFLSQVDYNFTHRIHRFSFGDPSPGILHPLEGDEKITSVESVLYQYFVEVVPTDIVTFRSKTQTYQYSAKENFRVINHFAGSHGVSGIFFKYDMSALKVLVSEEREPLIKFLVRMSATIGGIFIAAGFLNDWLQLLTSFILKTLPCSASCKWENEKHSVKAATTTVTNADAEIPRQIIPILEGNEVVKE